MREMGQRLVTIKFSNGKQELKMHCTIEELNTGPETPPGVHYGKNRQVPLCGKKTRKG